MNEIWDVDLADLTDYKISNNSFFRYVFVIIHKFSKNKWCVPLRNKNAETITDEVSRFITLSKQKHF